MAFAINYENIGGEVGKYSGLTYKDALLFLATRLGLELTKGQARNKIKALTGERGYFKSTNTNVPF